MAVSLKITDPQILNLLMGILVKEKPVNMGKGTEKIYCITRDEEGNFRVPVPLARQLWNIQTPDYTQLPRKQISCSIVLGAGGREHQIPTYQRLAEVMIAYKAAFLSSFCGFGKTLFGVKLFADLGLCTAVLTDSTVIFPQWVKVLKESTNAVVCEIKSPVDVLPPADIYVMMITACQKMSPKILEPVKLLLVDEALYFLTPCRIPGILNFTPCYTLGLCAEVKRADGMHCFLPHIFGNTVIRRISDKPFTVFRVETQFKPTVKQMRYGGRMDWNLVLESLADNKERNDMIVRLCREIPDSKIIVGTKRKTQAKYLYDELEKLGEKVGLLIEKATSFPQCRVLIGTYSKMGKGVDVKNLCENWEGEVFDVAILALDLTNPEQFVGRVFRHNNPVVYDIVDDFSTLRKHFEKERVPWYLTRNGTIHKIAL